MKIEKLSQFAILKLLSGRLILTILSGLSLVFIVYAVFTILMEKSYELKTDQVLLFASNIFLVIQSVFSSYFNKQRDDQKNQPDNKVDSNDQRK